MDKEPIIIDGVDVSRCNHYIEGFYSNCNETNVYAICRNNSNCYFKQLARKTQECEIWKNQVLVLDDENIIVQITQEQFEEYQRLKQECEELQKYIQEREVWGDHCEFCKHNDKENCHQNIILDNLKTINRYRKAIEEIEKLVQEFCMDCDEYKTCNFDEGSCYYSIIIPDLKDIINRIKEK